VNAFQGLSQLTKADSAITILLTNYCLRHSMGVCIETVSVLIFTTGTKLTTNRKLTNRRFEGTCCMIPSWELESVVWHKLHCPMCWQPVTHRKHCALGSVDTRSIPAQYAMHDVPPRTMHTTPQ
jgi:hypothetical protein